MLVVIMQGTSSGEVARTRRGSPLLPDDGATASPNRVGTEHSSEGPHRNPSRRLEVTERGPLATSSAAGGAVVAWQATTGDESSRQPSEAELGQNGQVHAPPRGRGVAI